MQKKPIYIILCVTLAMVIAALTLVFTIGPMVSAMSEHDRILVLKDWDDFWIEDESYYSQVNGNYAAGKTFYGLSSSIYCDLLGYDEDSCGGFYGSSAKLEEYDEIHIIIPEGVTTVSSFTTWGGQVEDEFLKKVTYVKLPSTLKIIAGIDDYNITSLEIPDGVKEIGGYAFYDWDNSSNNFKMTEIIIPESVEFIGQNAFDVESLNTIYCEAATKPDDWEDEWNSGCHVIFDCNKTVTFNANGGNPIENQKVCVNHLAVAPTNPVRNGFIFQYWFTDNENEAFNFNTPIENNLSLNAKWEAEATTTNPVDPNQSNENNQNQEPEQPTNNEEPESNVNVVAIAGGTAGGAVGLGTIGILIGFVIRKKRRLK